VYNALCQHFLKARAHDQGLEPFLSLSKITKRLEPSSPEPRIRSTTTRDGDCSGDFIKGCKVADFSAIIADFGRMEELLAEKKNHIRPLTKVAESRLIESILAEWNN
jgi:hypothetical protein